MTYINTEYGRNKDIKRSDVLKPWVQVSKMKCINLTMENYSAKPKLFTMEKKNEQILSFKKIETTNLLKKIFIYFLLSQVFH